MRGRELRLLPPPLCLVYLVVCFCELFFVFFKPNKGGFSFESFRQSTVYTRLTGMTPSCRSSSLPNPASIGVARSPHARDEASDLVSAWPSRTTEEAFTDVTLGFSGTSESGTLIFDRRFSSQCEQYLHATLPTLVYCSSVFYLLLFWLYCFCVIFFPVFGSCLVSSVCCCFVDPSEVWSFWIGRNPGQELFESGERCYVW